MPLPPPPAKRAALLAPETFDAVAPPVGARAQRRTGSAAGIQPAQSPVPVAPAVKQPITDGQETHRSAPAEKTTSRRRNSTDARTAEPVAAAPVRAEPRKARTRGPAKLFVVDTNVLMHDPMCLFRFEEHDIFLPMIVLEELDGHKKGMTEVARNARQASRTLDALAGAVGADIAAGLKLDTTGHREAGGKLFFQTQPLNYTLPASLPQGKADNQILGVVEALRQQETTREVVLVSKDINMRVKARALGLAAEDYQNDKTLEDGDMLYAGSLALPPDFWSKHGKTI